MSEIKILKMPDVGDSKWNVRLKQAPASCWDAVEVELYSNHDGHHYMEGVETSVYPHNTVCAVDVVAMANRILTRRKKAGQIRDELNLSQVRWS